MTIAVKLCRIVLNRKTSPETESQVRAPLIYRRRFGEIRLPFPPLHPLRNRYNRTATKYVLAAFPVQPLQQSAFDSYNFWISAFKDMSMQDAAAALIAEIAVLFSPTVASAWEVWDGGIVVDAEKREDSRGAECAWRLFPTSDAMAMEEVQWRFRGGGERNWSASARTIHDAQT